MTVLNAKVFKPGDLVIAFESERSGPKWKPVFTTKTYEGEVTKVEGGKVYIDTNFGELPFDHDAVEYGDIPF